MLAFRATKKPWLRHTKSNARARKKVEGTTFLRSNTGYVGYVAYGGLGHQIYLPLRAFTRICSARTVRRFLGDDPLVRGFPFRGDAARFPLLAAFLVAGPWMSSTPTIEPGVR